jgi:hypothetical protein
MTAKTLAFAFAFALSAVAGAQSWSRSYDAGLASARAGKWAAARESFQQAAAVRPDDRSAPTVLPGPATERKLWRDGAPYSPNFLAAYSLYRQALVTADAMEASGMLRTAAGEFETLVAKDQSSAEAFFFLDVIYTKLGDATKRQTAADRMTKLGRKVDFKIDDEIVAPEELASLQTRTVGTAGVTTLPAPTSPGTAPVVLPGNISPGTGTVAANGVVIPVPEKFALIVGQGQSRVSGGMVPFAATDALRVRDALVNFAGYPADNVVMLQNSTASEIKTAAAALATRVGENAAVTIFYAGAGVNLGGKDYLAGVDTESTSDTASMLGKTELFLPFVQRGARVFAFFEANRPMDTNRTFFGSELPTIGSISEVQATPAGSLVGASYQNNQQVGLFAAAFTQVLTELRVNRLPIYNFTWLVADAMRRGSSGLSGGGGSQVCILPKLRGLAADAKF